MSGIERLYTPPQIGPPGRAAARQRGRQLRRTGAFVVSLALVLVAALAVLEYRSLIAIHIDTFLPYTDGLSAGAIIEEAGYTIGSVTEVTPVLGAERDVKHGCLETANTPCFRIRLRIRGDWRIPKNSTAVLGTRLLQGAVIRLQPGDDDAVLSDGGRIRGEGREGSLTVNIDKLVGKVTELLEHVRSIMDQTIQPMLASISTQVSALQNLTVSSGGTGSGEQGAALSDVGDILANLKQLTGDLATRGDQRRDTDVGRLVQATRQAAEHVEAITASINSRSARIREAVEQFTQLGEELNHLVQTSGPNVDRTLIDVQYMIQETATALTPILNTIDETTRNLLELSRDLRDNPGVLIGGRNTRDNAPDNYR